MTVLIEAAPASVPIVAITAAELPAWLSSQSARSQRWVAASAFSGLPGGWCAESDAEGNLARILVGFDPAQPLAALAGLPLQLPPGDYRLEPPIGAPASAIELIVLGFALGAYQFTRYRAARRAPARLVLPAGLDAQRLLALATATTRVRDLVNTPTEDMGPTELAAAAQLVAQQHGATYREWIGDELLTANFPAIHAVGRASHRAPRFVEVSWGDAAHPHVVLVGKGVCFDTGGLDLKAAEFMRWMKKDMGGAAHAIALAELVMSQRLPLRVTLLVAAVENAVGPNAFRPGEVIHTRLGHRVEIDNTDAEGRVVLGDALSYAAELSPALVVDFATLTGAARIALGPDLPALFCNRDGLAEAILACGRDVHDPLWRMPLWRPYRAMFDSTIADFANSGPGRNGGAITAALYLERFVPETLPWAHIDVYSWNDGDRPGRPRGGEAQSLRAFFALLERGIASSY
jgi:leucyl aminopeptidase